MRKFIQITGGIVALAALLFSVSEYRIRKIISRD